ncbi:MAG: hypothetical protein ACPG31_04885 [Planctomycetota bacterium]
MNLLNPSAAVLLLAFAAPSYAQEEKGTEAISSTKGSVEATATKIDQETKTKQEKGKAKGTAKGKANGKQKPDEAARGKGKKQGKEKKAQASEAGSKKEQAMKVSPEQRELMKAMTEEMGKYRANKARIKQARAVAAKENKPELAEKADAMEPKLEANHQAAMDALRAKYGDKEFDAAKSYLENADRGTVKKGGKVTDKAEKQANQHSKGVKGKGGEKQKNRKKKSGEGSGESSEEGSDSGSDDEQPEA